MKPSSALNACGAARLAPGGAAAASRPVAADGAAWLKVDPRAIARAAAIALAAALVAACSGPPPAEKPPRVVLVKPFAAERGEAARHVYSGEVRARFETDLAFRIGGKVVERRVEVGTAVRRGDVIARLDPEDVRLAASAVAAQVAAAEAEAALARAEFERSEGLRAANFISASALDARRTALAAAEARLRQARAQAAAARNQADYATLAAEHDGVVTAVHAEAGQVVTAGAPVVRVTRGAEREILIHVPEGRLQDYAVGSPAAVRLWANGTELYPARVREVAPAADAATRSYALRVSVGDAALPLGATASVALPSPAGAAAVLPLTAVTRADGRPVVWVVDAASRVQPQPVEIGAIREDGVEIRGGLAAGASVVQVGAHRLIGGERVRPVAADAPIALDITR